MLQGNDGAKKVPTGQVKFYIADRGFGFLKPDGGGPDIFVHISACEREPMEGDRVRYEEQISNRTGKPQAINVVPTD
jgi:cold shock protein